MNYIMKWKRKNGQNCEIRAEIEIDIGTEVETKTEIGEDENQTKILQPRQTDRDPRSQNIGTDIDPRSWNIGTDIDPRSRNIATDRDPRNQEMSPRNQDAIATLPERTKEVEKIYTRMNLLYKMMKMKRRT